MASTSNNKILAIIGFVIAIIFLLWLAVKIVAFLPSAFSSLASIADSVQNYRPTESISVTTVNSVVNAGAPFIIFWDKIENPGTFTFTYDCDTEAELSTVQDGETVLIACGETFVFPATEAFEITANSDEQRFTDIVYTVTFTPERGDVVSDSNTVTIVNAMIPTGGLAEKEEAGETDDTTVVTPAPETSPSTGGTNETYYHTVSEVTYSTPVSNPNGYTDLEVKFVAIGTFDSNNNFRRATSLKTDEPGVLRFYVKNIGTKTSDDWSFDATLPTGTTYNSPSQSPLKPNEQSVLTIRFGEVQKTGVASFTVDIDTDEDINSSNDELNWAIAVTN